MVTFMLVILIGGQGCRFVPYTFLETKPQLVPTDLNIGFRDTLFLLNVHGSLVALVVDDLACS